MLYRKGLVTIVRTSPLPWGVFGGGLSHFSECLHRRDLYQYIKSGFWVGLGIFGGGGFFRWDLKTPCIKNSECEYQAKNDTNCNFSNFSILVPYPN